MAFMTGPDHDAAVTGVEARFRSDYRALVGLARLLVDDLGQAEEVVQDAFVALHRHWPRVGDPGAWLRTTVVNGARGRLRRKAVGRRHLRVAEPPLTAPPDERVLLADDALAVLAALRALPHRQRAVVALRYWAHLSESEIAATLGISTGSVKTHAHRAMGALAVSLEALR